MLACADDVVPQRHARTTFSAGSLGRVPGSGPRRVHPPASNGTRRVSPARRPRTAVRPLPAGGHLRGRPPGVPGVSSPGLTGRDGGGTTAPPRRVAWSARDGARAHAHRRSAPARRPLPQGQAPVVKTVLDGARHRFQVAAAETGHQDEWQRAAARVHDHRRPRPGTRTEVVDRSSASCGRSPRSRCCPPDRHLARDRLRNEGRCHHDDGGTEAGDGAGLPRTARLNELVREIIGEELERIDDSRLVHRDRHLGRPSRPTCSGRSSFYDHLDGPDGRRGGADRLGEPASGCRRRSGARPA